MAESITSLDSASEPDDGAAPDGKARRLRLLIMAGGAAGLLAVGASIAFFTGALDGMFGPAPPEAAAAAAGQPAPIVFYALPDLVVSLNTNERQSTFLKVKISLELPDQATAGAVERVMPRIIDQCQVYLRELRPDDLRGSAGTLRLRQELRRRIAIAVAPAEVRDVLFVDLLIQ